MALALVLDRKNAKRNVAKAARDLCSQAHLRGIGLTQPTAKRLIRDIYKRDDPYLRTREMGREGERLFELQHGSYKASAPLEVVYIDHTPFDAKHTLGGHKAGFRPTLTTASDLYSGCLLAAFVSLFPPCRTTVALAMALITADKSSILRDFGVPGEWECGGVPSTIMVDAAAEFARSEFEWVCTRYDIELIVGGGGGRPELRSPHERIFRTLNSEIHSLPGTTMSNAGELKKYGGMRAVELDFLEIQRRLLIAVTEYNHETYGGSDLAPIVAWRGAISEVPHARRPVRDDRHVFIDFLPSCERTLSRAGLKLENCYYRGKDLLPLRYERQRTVKVHFDPRDMDRVYIPVGAGLHAHDRLVEQIGGQAVWEAFGVVGQNGRIHHVDEMNAPVERWQGRA